MTAYDSRVIPDMQASVPEERNECEVLVPRVGDVFRNSWHALRICVVRNSSTSMMSDAW